ncbi:MAG: acetate--CoA ligase family protein [Woeseiaceae bacterium]|nr:acetate--CoA ligase family protein [Woeseiaceae bacterium]
MTRVQALQRLLRPKSIAVIGGDSAAEVARQCRAMEFDGALWAVNPHRAELGGIECVESIEQLPAVPDASFVAAPPETSLQIIQQLAKLGAPGAVCFAAGFAEVGEEGARLQRELREVSGDMAIMGPNCHGYLNYLDGVALWPDQHGGERVASGAALVLQSGNLGISMTMQQRGLDLGYVISVGNNGVLGIHHYIETLLEDSRVTAIGLHIEGIDDVAAFSVAAIKALKKGIPVVALKTGRSERGSEITLSHTGSLAGPDRLYDALFERVGVARCDTVSQFLETLKFLSLVGPLADDSVGSMSCSGGDASLVADCADRLRLPMPKFSDRTTARLKTLLGPKVHVSNPLDYHLYIWGDYAKLLSCFTEVLRNNFACALLVLDYPTGDERQTEKWEITERALVDAAAATGRAAIIVSTLPESLPENVRIRLKAAGIAPMQGIDDCLYAIRAATFVGASQARAESVLPVMAPAQSKGDVVALDEWESKQVLSEFGLSIPDGRLCNAAEVLNAAEALGYPVALKAASAGVTHKTEAGAVALGLADAASLSDALIAMQDRFERFIVEEMVGPTVVEIIVGVSRDRNFGLSLLLGVGGTLVELIEDAAFLLLPLQRADVDRALGALRIARLLDGYRGQPGGDRDALVTAVENIGRFAEAYSDSLHELDVNPILVMPHGVVAADALIRKTKNH